MMTLFLRSLTLISLGLLVFVISLPIACATPETWTSTGSMGTPRMTHTATLLLNGKVLVAGGSPANGSAITLSSAELYDPATGMWTSTGAMNG